MEKRTRIVYNFSPGPAVLNREVLNSASEAVLDFAGSGMSILEISHRSAAAMELVEETSALVKELLALPAGYQVIWLQGGASLQFSMVPMNLLEEDQTADYADTGAWSAKAIREAQPFGKVQVVCSSRESNYDRIPGDWEGSPQAVYLHLTSNNTIFGTQWKSFPLPRNPAGYLVADMSSDIFSRPLDLKPFGLIYAGAQKNMGPAGVTLVIIREDILGRVSRTIPTMLDYRTHLKSGSLFNTPPVFNIYVVNRTLHWIVDLGGVEAIQRRNRRKAERLYAEIDRNALFYNPVAEEDRSLMNVTFLLKETGLEKEFLTFSGERGLLTLKGHRSVGGFRASIYNAMPEEGVEALIAALQEFENLRD